LTPILFIFDDLQTTNDDSSFNSCEIGLPEKHSNELRDVKDQKVKGKVEG
jgi:hypothetical protein